MIRSRIIRGFEDETPVSRRSRGSTAGQATRGSRRRARNEEAGRGLLGEALGKLETGTWPNRVLQYLQGAIDGGKLVELAGSDAGNLTEAHAFLGVNLAIGGDRDGARTHLERVEKHGVKACLESPLAVAELKRLGE